MARTAGNDFAFAQRAIAQGSSTPDPGVVGAVIWSTTAAALLVWNGLSWEPVAAGVGSPVVITPPQITADQTDYNPASFGTATVVRLSSDAARTIRSLATRANGTVVTLVNHGTFAITLSDEDAAGTAAQRFALNGNFVLYPETVANIVYDGTTARWRSESSSVEIGSVANDREVLFSNAGVLAGAARTEIDTDGNLRLMDVAATPSAPIGGVTLYSNIRAGRRLPFMIGPSGVDTALQVGLHGNSIAMFAPANGTTAPTQWGITLTTAATISHQQTIASANPWLATRKTRFQTSTTAGNASGCRTAYAQWFRGNAANFGGFWFRAQTGKNINLNGGQKFVGLCASTAVLASTAGAVSALLNMLGMGYDTTDASTGNWFFYRNDGAGTATRVDLGANAARNTTHGYDLIMFCPRGAATEIFVRIVNLHTGTVVLDTSYTTDIPSVNVGMAFKCEVNNGAVAAADNIEIAKLYIESDY
jgi:hypothetical protein